MKYREGVRIGNSLASYRASHVLLAAVNAPGHAATGFLVIDGRLRELPNPAETGYTRWWDLSDTGWLIGTTGMSAVEGQDGRSRGIVVELTR